MIAKDPILGIINPLWEHRGWVCRRTTRASREAGGNSAPARLAAQVKPPASVSQLQKVPGLVHSSLLLALR